jgi:hypothetical protein
MDAVMSSTHYRTSWQVLSFSSSTRVTSIWRMAALSRSSTAQWDVHARGWEEKIGQLGPTLFPFGYSPLARVVDVVVSSIDFEFRISGFTNSTAEDQQSFQNFDQHRSACTSAACFVPVPYNKMTAELLASMPWSYSDRCVVFSILKQCSTTILLLLRGIYWLTQSSFHILVCFLFAGPFYLLRTV